MNSVAVVDPASLAAIAPQLPAAVGFSTGLTATRHDVTWPGLLTAAAGRTARA